MVRIEPIPDQPAAVIENGDRFLVIADYHAGFEAALRYEEGVELRSRAPDRKDRLIGLLDRIDPAGLVILGDVTHSIGEPGGAERGELEILFADIDIPVTIAKGNHDGALDNFVDHDPEHFGGITVTDSDGGRIGSVGIVHGHTWPAVDVLDTDILCIGHEHPCVRLVDDVGGSRTERVWLRGQLDPDPFAAFHDQPIEQVPELVVVPAFNELCGGTWVNVSDQDFLAPFLPGGLLDGDIHLLDGTFLGSIESLRS